MFQKRSSLMLRTLSEVGISQLKLLTSVLEVFQVCNARSEQNKRNDFSGEWLLSWAAAACIKDEEKKNNKT